MGLTFAKGILASKASVYYFDPIVASSSEVKE